MTSPVATGSSTGSGLKRKQMLLSIVIVNKGARANSECHFLFNFQFPLFFLLDYTALGIHCNPHIRFFVYLSIFVSFKAKFSVFTMCACIITLQM